VDEKFISRFWSKVNKRGPVPSHAPELGECWVWTRGKAAGYGSLSGPGGSKTLYAHRLAFELAAGPIEGGLFVLHKCDNRACCRPDHLFLGTQRDNIRDCSVKGRLGSQIHPERLARGLKNGAYTKSENLPRGSGHGMSKLTDESVAAIRAALQTGETGRSIAARFGVSAATISWIKVGRGWAHLL
jgi:hypothetical protein